MTQTFRLLSLTGETQIELQAPDFGVVQVQFLWTFEK